MTRPAHYDEYPLCSELVPGVFFSADDGIYIVDDEGEVCCWVESEWVEDPTVTLTIAAAVALATAKGAAAVRQNIAFQGHLLVALQEETFAKVNDIEE